MSKKYAIGIDFGTLSARAVLVCTDNGEVIASAVSEYAHKVMERELPCGIKLKPDSALQHPQDYLDALHETVGTVLRESGVSADDIVGVATDFTSSTVFPIDSDGTPLCFKEEYQSSPHAYAKMWKDHTSHEYSERLRTLSEERGEAFLGDYSGKISSEWLIPKLAAIAVEDESLYNDTAKYIEAGDFIVMKLTGSMSTSSGNAGFKALWNSDSGFPSGELLHTAYPDIKGDLREKIVTNVLPVGSIAGYVDRDGALLTGLCEGTPVCVNMIDAHAAIPAVGITAPGKLLMIMGTSTCHLAMSKEKKKCKGVTGVVKDGFVHGYYAYEAGQNCVGDCFDWFVTHMVPAEYTKEAQTRDIGIHALLSEKAEKKRAGENGLLALDWWNGCRSDLLNDRLSGMILGMNLSTRAEDIYRALIEATAFGTRLICENYRSAGIIFDEIIASGGIAKKNPLMMQIYADIVGTPIHIAETDQAGALGCAVMAAAAGSAWRNITEAAQAMVKPCVKTYYPNPESTCVYDKLYAEYVRMHDILSEDDSPTSLLYSLRTS
ncbi:MAG: ribulokinase [Clostridia bacterium]|nr:ribulokinase [Clostridia bacterium]